MTVPWHVSPARAEAYLADAVDQVTASSIEAHLLACAPCREVLADRTATADLLGSWARIEAAIDAAPATLPERIGAHLRVPDHVGRVLAPTAALRGAGVLAGIAAFLTSALLARSGTVLPGELGRLVFLTVAPLIPLATVLSTLESAGNPVAELATAAPMRRLWLAALRAGAVLTVTIVTGLIVSAMLPGPWIGAVRWLAPSLGVTALGALATRRIEPAAAVGLTGAGWVALVIAAATWSDDRLAAFRSTPQLLYLAVAALAAGAIAASPSSLDLGGHR